MMSRKHKPTRSGSEKKLPPEALTATDWAILKHVSLYHFTIRHAVQELFFDSDGSKAGTALDALARHSYLSNQEESNPSQALKAASNQKSTSKKSSGSQASQNKPLKIGGVKYYLLGNSSSLLAPQGFRFPKERFTPPKTEQSLYKHLAALWYCFFDGQRRYRLDRNEIAKLWMDTIPENRKVPHQPAYCLANKEQGPIIYRLYPTRKPKVIQIVEEVRKKLENDASTLRLKHWIEAGEYSYAIIVPSHERKRDVERELVKFRKQYPRLAGSVSAHYAPSPTLLKKALDENGNGTGDGMTAKIRPQPDPPQDANDLPSTDASPKDEPPGFEFYTYTT